VARARIIELGGDRDSIARRRRQDGARLAQHRALLADELVARGAAGANPPWARGASTAPGPGGASVSFEEPFHSFPEYGPGSAGATEEGRAGR